MTNKIYNSQNTFSGIAVSHRTHSVAKTKENCKNNDILGFVFRTW